MTEGNRPHPDSHARDEAIRDLAARARVAALHRLARKNIASVARRDPHHGVRVLQAAVVDGVRLDGGCAVHVDGLWRGEHVDAGARKGRRRQRGENEETVQQPHCSGAGGSYSSSKSN